MRIEVRFFASLADRAGTRAVTIEIDPDADLASLWRLLEARHPALAGLPSRPLAACDLVCSSWDRKIRGVSEVGFFPPFSGG